MMTKDDIATYRVTYPRAYWEKKAKEQNFHCVAPLGAVFAVNALCDAYEEIEKQRDELLAACEKTISENGHLADGDVCTLIDFKRAIARVKGQQ